MEIERELHYADVVVKVKISSRTGLGNKLMQDRRELFHRIVEGRIEDLRSQLDPVVPMTPRRRQ